MFQAGRKVPGPEASPAQAPAAAIATTSAATPLESSLKQLLGKQKLVFPDIPTPGKARDFQRDLATLLNSASGLFDNSVVPWVQQIWANGTTFEDRAVCEKKLQLLDQQLAGAAQVALKEGKPKVTLELARRVNKRADEAIAKGVMLTGRQYVWIL